MKNITNKMKGKQIFIPIVALILLAVFNLIVDPSFYKITMDYRTCDGYGCSHTDVLSTGCRRNERHTNRKNRKL